MRRRPLALLAFTAVLAAGCMGSTDAALETTQTETTAVPVANEAAPPRPRPVVENCSTRSFADFTGAFADPANLVVGPFVLVGGANPTSAATAEEFGGQKYPVLVREGRAVTVEVPEAARAFASLGYGPLPQGDVGIDDGHAAVTFTACAPRSDSVTFWSGFVFVREPSCVPLDVYVDDEPAPRRVEIELGRPC